VVALREGLTVWTVTVLSFVLLLVGGLVYMANTEPNPLGVPVEGVQLPTLVD